MLENIKSCVNSCEKWVGKMEEGIFYISFAPSSCIEPVVLYRLIIGKYLEMFSDEMVLG